MSQRKALELAHEFEASIVYRTGAIEALAPNGYVWFETDSASIVASFPLGEKRDAWDDLHGMMSAGLVPVSK